MITNSKPLYFKRVLHPIHSPQEKTYLKKQPETASKARNGPGDKYQKGKPDDGEKEVLGHGDGG